MKYADLHIHSSYSDGCKTPEEIIDSAIKNKIIEPPSTTMLFMEVVSFMSI